MNSEDYDDAPDMTQYERPEPDASQMLKMTRAHLGMSQATAARLLNVPKSTLQGWEQRRFSPDGASSALIMLLYQYPDQISEMLKGNLTA